MRVRPRSLIQQLEAEIAIVEEDFKRMRVVVDEWHRRGDDPSELLLLEIDADYARWLLLVADGRLLLKVVVGFFWSKPLVNRLAKLPLAEQERLCDPATTVRVVLSSDTGEVKHIHPSELTVAEVDQVFG